MMITCTKCGTKYSDDAPSCPYCGTPQDLRQQTPTYAAPSEYYREDSNDKVMGILSYCGLLCLIPMFTAKDSEFVRYHVKQGATICFFSIIYSFINFLLTIIVNVIFPPFYQNDIVGWVSNPVASVINTTLSLVHIFFLVLALMGISSVLQKQTKEIPIVCKITFVGDLIDKYVYKSE